MYNGIHKCEPLFIRRC